MGREGSRRWEHRRGRGVEAIITCRGGGAEGVTGGEGSGGLGGAWAAAAGGAAGGGGGGGTAVVVVSGGGGGGGGGVGGARTERVGEICKRLRPCVHTRRAGRSGAGREPVAKQGVVLRWATRWC